MTIFTDWLENELAAREMSPAALARAMRKDQGIISRILSGERIPAPKTLLSISRALNLPPEDIFRAAGLLPPKIDASKLESKINHLVSLLPTDNDKQDVLAYVELRMRIAERRGKYVTRKDKTQPSEP